MPSQPDDLNSAEIRHLSASDRLALRETVEVLTREPWPPEAVRA